MKALALVIAALVSSSAASQVYIWRDPNTGTVQMDGSAPSWYRSGQGPRVQLWQGFNIVDDTAWKDRQPVVYVTRTVVVEAPPVEVPRQLSDQEKKLAEADRLMNMKGGGIGAALVAQELRASARGEKSAWRRAIERDQEASDMKDAIKKGVKEGIRDCLANRFPC